MLHETDTYREIKQQPQTLKKTFDIVQGQHEAFKQFVNQIEQTHSGKKLKVLFTGGIKRLCRRCRTYGTQHLCNAKL